VGVAGYGFERDNSKAVDTKWMEEYLGDRVKTRPEEWKSSIVVGSKSFIENVKALLGFRLKVGVSLGTLSGISSGKARLPIMLFLGPKTTK
jgi:hypothetical protein